MVFILIGVVLLCVLLLITMLILLRATHAKKCSEMTEKILIKGGRSVCKERKKGIIDEVIPNTNTILNKH